MQANKAVHLCWPPLLAVLALMAGCGGDTSLDTSAIESYTIENEPIVKEFNELYANVENSLAVSNEDDTKAIWTSNVILQENRYNLYLEFDATIDIDAGTLTRDGEPEFFIAQNPDPTGGTSGSGDVKTAEFGEDQWQKIVAGKGKLTPVLRLIK